MLRSYACGVSPDAGYSIWTNHNYKAPLIASAVACLVGNLAYCMSYDLGAVWLLFLARLVTGLGVLSVIMSIGREIKFCGIKLQAETHAMTAQCV